MAATAVMVAADEDPMEDGRGRGRDASLHKTVEVFTKKKIVPTLDKILFTLMPSFFCDNILITTSTTSKYSDSPWCEPIASPFRYVFLVVFIDKKVSWITESHKGIHGSWPVLASTCHVTTCLF
jgi:hypothetical protein